MIDLMIMIFRDLNNLKNHLNLSSNTLSWSTMIILRRNSSKEKHLRVMNNKQKQQQVNQNSIKV